MTHQNMEDRISQLDENLTNALPPIKDLLSLKVEDEAYLKLQPKQKKDKAFKAIRDLLIGESQNNPLVIAVEDLHWMDKTSEELLGYLIEWLANTYILLILLYRPEYKHTWGSKSYYRKIGLTQLTSQASADLIRAILYDCEIEPELETLILNRSAGNPLFIEELTHSLLENGSIQREKNQCFLSIAPKDIQVPDTIQGIIAARMDRLEDNLKHTMQVASVIGRDFAFRILQTVIGLGEDLKAYLLSLQRMEFIYEKNLSPEQEYIFKHALTQEVAYNSLLHKRRKDIHEKIGEAIEQIYADTLEEFYEMLAYHFTEGGLTEKAIVYWQQAGQKAIQRSANAEAIRHLSKGLQLIKILPDNPKRAQLELSLQINLGSALMATKGYGAEVVEKAYARARELCQQVGEPSQLSPVLRGLWVFYNIRAEYQKARELGEQILALAQNVQDPALLLEGHRALAITLFELGELTFAQTHLEMGIALYDPQLHRSHAFLYGQDPGVGYQSQMAVLLWTLGFPDQALKRIHNALTLAQKHAHPFSLAGALILAAIVHQLRREGDETQKRAEAAITLSTDQGFSLFVPMGTILRGWALAQQGKIENGMAQMQQGLAAYRDTGAEWLRPYFLAMIAEAYGKGSQAEKAANVLAEALTVVHKSCAYRWEAELYRLKGELLLAHDSVGPCLKPISTSEAATCFRQAINIARRQEAKSLELRAVLSLSRLMQEQGKKEEALQMLAQTFGWFNEGFSTADLKEAKSLLKVS